MDLRSSERRLENGEWKLERKWRMGGENLRESEECVKVKSEEEALSEWVMSAYIELGEGWLEVENWLEISWGCFGHFGQFPKVVRS